MSTDQRLFLDANVFMYAAGREHPLKALCAEILRRVADGTIKATTNTEVLREIVHRFSAIGRLSDGLRLARLTIDQLNAEILAVDVSDMPLAFDLLDRYGDHVKTRDAVHAAIMLNRGLTRIITADAHFDAITEVKRLSPTQFLATGHGAPEPSPGAGAPASP